MLVEWLYGGLLIAGSMAATYYGLRLIRAGRSTDRSTQTALRQCGECGETLGVKHRAVGGYEVDLWLADCTRRQAVRKGKMLLRKIRREARADSELEGDLDDFLPKDK